MHFNRREKKTSKKAGRAKKKTALFFRKPKKKRVVRSYPIARRRTLSSTPRGFVRHERGLRSATTSFNGGVVEKTPRGKVMESRMSRKEVKSGQRCALQAPGFWVPSSRWGGGEGADSVQFRGGLFRWGNPGEGRKE